MKARSEWKQPKRSPLRPSCTPIARESEKAKARRLSAISGKKRTAPKASNPARKAREFARAYHSKARVEFVKGLGCVYCTALHPLFGVVTAGKSHNAHTVTGGGSRKADFTTIVPLCASHHRLYDEHQFPFDTEKVRDAIKSACPDVERMWLAHLEALGA